jgi:hypothetical protein
MALLRMLKDKHPNLLRELDAAQIAWWERFVARPQFSLGLVRLGFAMLWLCLFALPAVPVSSIGYRIVLVLAAYGVVFAALLAARLYLIDWPVALITQRWRGRPPLKVQIGWLPMLIGVSGMTTVLSNAPVFWWSGAVLGGMGCLWAIYVSGPMPSVIQSRSIQLANSHLAMAAIVNAAVAPWWFMTVPEFTSRRAPPTSLGASSVGALCLMCGAGFGVRVLAKVWTERLTEAQRKWCTIGLVPCAALVGVAVWLGSVNVWLRPFLAWLVVTFVVMHRIACVNFSAGQLRTRAVLLVSSGVVGSALIGGDAFSMAAPVLQLGTVMLLCVAVLNLGMALHNQRARGY